MKKQLCVFLLIINSAYAQEIGCKFENSFNQSSNLKNAEITFNKNDLNKGQFFALLKSGGTTRELNCTGEIKEGYKTESCLEGFLSQAPFASKGFNKDTSIIIECLKDNNPYLKFNYEYKIPRCATNTVQTYGITNTISLGGSLKHQGNVGSELFSVIEPEMKYIDYLGVVTENINIAKRNTCYFK